jgi:2-hydroxymuconate-semialdehyde hydrolase
MTMVGDKIKDFISRELLEGHDVDLTESTPLLELGIIDSVSIVLLQRFVQSELGVEIPFTALTPENLHSIAAMCRLIERLKAPADS